MRSHLVFTLYGPLQAWGTMAVGEIRPTAAHPTRSGVLGLLAAALGIRRDAPGRLMALDQAYGLAVRVDAAGMRLVDYHTVQTPREKKKRRFHCRRDEVAAKLERHEDLNTILSRREYLADARFTACVWAREAAAPYSLDELLAALAAPKLTLYLGRKSCPAGPLAPAVVEAADALAALAAYAIPGETGYPGFDSGERPIFSDKGGCASAERARFTVRDRLESPATRRFVTRTELLHYDDSPEGR